MQRHLLVGFEWLAAYIADVTNAFVADAPNFTQIAPSAVDSVVEQMATLQKTMSAYFLRDEAVKKLIFETLALGMNGYAPEAAAKIPWPKKGEQPGEGELDRQLHQAELHKYAGQISRFGLRQRNMHISQSLVDAALRLEGWFHWVNSGPTDRQFFPKEKTGGGETNHFVEWVHGRGSEPGMRANMNCWEAVFFAAYKAGLLSIANLRVIHTKATIAARQSSGDSYFRSLLNSLGYADSFPYVPSVGLVPAPGDVVFFQDEHHVALCVGNGDPIKVMSHWKHPRDGFRSYRIGEFTGPRFEVRFSSLPV
jgi:hypothetical protein